MKSKVAVTTLQNVSTVHELKKTGNRSTVAVTLVMKSHYLHKN